MQLRKKVAINVSVWFSVFFGLLTLFIYLSFSSFRKYEFEYMLEERAFSNMLDAKDVTPPEGNKIFSEICLVFDKDFKLIFSNSSNKVVHWDNNKLEQLTKGKKIYSRNGETESLAIRFIHDKQAYYVLISAVDKYGYSKLNFLFWSLIATYAIGMLLMWYFTNYFVSRSVKPLITFKDQIASISLSEATPTLNENIDIDEIGELAIKFNQMLRGIQEAYNSQKEFTANASHELRTPLSRATLQVDNLLSSNDLTPKQKDYLLGISQNLTQITELITSLLILSKVQSKDELLNFSLERIDEILFDAYNEIKQIEPNFQLNFEIIESEENSTDLEIRCNRPLLKILFANLLKNGCLYSLNSKVYVVIDLTRNYYLRITLRNNGNSLTPNEVETIFEPFKRGTNSNNSKGLGLGLRIVKGILSQHNGTIKYFSSKEFEHNFEINLPY